MDLFDNLIGKTWTAEGTWEDGSKFKQEVTLSKTIEGKLITSETSGYINKNRTKWGQRNFGIRKWDSELKAIVFTEHDVFGETMQGTVTSNSKGDIIYSYQYRDLNLTDYWQKINDYSYKLTIGVFKNDSFEQTYLDAFVTSTNHSKDFDFWIGEWDVYNLGTDKIAGYSHIQSVHNGNAIFESYHTEKKQFTGSSLNKYNFEIGKWEQFWVDNSGLTLHLTGGISDGKMILEGFTGNNKTLNKITWTLLENGDVRQLWEQKDLGSKSEEWNSIADLQYKNKS